MRSHLLPTALAAILVTLPSTVASAKMSDRLAQRNVGTDDGAAPPGDYSGGDEYSGGELGWGEDTSDDVADVSGGEGDLLRGQAPDGEDVVDVGGYDTDPSQELASLDWESFARNTPNRVACAGTCAFVTTAMCFGSVGGALTSWAEFGTTTVPWLLAAGATCGALVTNQCQDACDKVYQ